MAVILESAGEHSFDIGHLRRSDAELLIQSLLEKANVYNSHDWRVRINEKQQCSGLTPPVSIVNYKPWGVYVRMKPGDNNTCHNITLLTPSGDTAQSIFNKLKSVEKSFNRSWRKKEPIKKENVLITAPVTEPIKKENVLITALVASPVTESVFDTVPPQPSLTSEIVSEEKTLPESERTDLVFWMKNPENIRQICVIVQKLTSLPFISNTYYMEALCKHLKLNVTNHQSGSMMRSLVGRGLVGKTLVKKSHIGYHLTIEGVNLITKPDAPKTLVRIPLNRAKIIKDVGSIASDLAGAAQRLTMIQDEKERLFTQVQELEKQEKEICDMLNGTEVEDILSKLAEIQKPIQGKGKSHA